MSSPKPSAKYVLVKTIITRFSAPQSNGQPFSSTILTTATIITSR